MLNTLITIAALVLTTAGQVAAQSTIFVVRHAERADAAAPAGSMMTADPELSAAGQARADALARVLRDARITAIYATEFKRTQQTAAPLARALGLTVTVVPAKDGAALLARLKASTGNVLVVGHSNTVGEIVQGLGVATPVTVGDADYDNLFMVTHGQVVRLHYK